MKEQGITYALRQIAPWKHVGLAITWENTSCLCKKDINHGVSKSVVKQGGWGFKWSDFGSPEQRNDM